MQTKKDKILCHKIGRFLLIQIGILFIVSAVLAVPPKKAMAPTIGEKIPEIVFSNVINSLDKTIRLSDLQGKLVVLDFYGTWCGSCQPGIPHLNSLQKRFGDRLQIIVVCHDRDNSTVEKTIASRWKEISLPFVLTNDSLNFIFPHKMIPHEVWISPQGKFLATTDADAVNETNITSILNGSIPVLKQKNDQMAFDRNKPLFVDGNGGGTGDLKLRSVFSGHIEGIISGAGNNIDTVNRLKRTYFLNLPPLDLYLSAAHMRNPNRVVIELKDSSRIIPDKKDEKTWYENNTYCYEITYPLGWNENVGLRQKWLADINCGLGMNGHLEKRKVRCWVISTIKENDSSLYSHEQTPLFTELNATSGRFKEMRVYTFRNKPVGFLMQILNDKDQPIILDETRIRKNIDIDIPVAHLYSIASLKADLYSYGLQMQSVIRDVEVLVISDY